MALSPEHMARRKGRVTSSIAAAALGLSKWMTPLQAKLSILGKLPSQDSKATDRGHRLEYVTLEYAADETGLRLETPAPYRTLHEWTGDSTDALYYRGAELAAIGEAKTAAAGSAADYGEEGTDEVPDSTLVQAHWHLIHWPEVNLCHVPVLVGGYEFEFRLYQVARDAEFEGILLQDLDRWYRDYIVGGKDPPARADDCDTVKRLYPMGTAGAVELTPELEDAARRYDEARKAHAAAEDHKKEWHARICQAMGEHEIAKSDHCKVSWKNNKPSHKTDWEAVAKACNPASDIVARYTTEKPGARVLNVTIKEGGSK